MHDGTFTVGGAACKRLYANLLEPGSGERSVELTHQACRAGQSYPSPPCIPVCRRVWAMRDHRQRPYDVNHPGFFSDAVPRGQPMLDHVQSGNVAMFQSASMPASVTHTAANRKKASPKRCPKSLLQRALCCPREVAAKRHPLDKLVMSTKQGCPREVAAKRHPLDIVVLPARQGCPREDLNLHVLANTRT